MFGALHITYYLFGIVLCLIGISVYHKKSAITKKVIFFTVVIITGDALGLFLAFLKIASFKEALLKYLISTVVLLAMVSNESGIRWFGKMADFTKIFLFIVAVVVMLMPFPNDHWQSYPFLINQVIWVVVTLVALLDQLKKEDPSPLWRRAYFWFMAGNFCFYCFSFLLFPLRASSVQGLWNSQLHNDLILWACVFLYSSITLGIVLDKTQPAVPYAQ